MKTKIIYMHHYKKCKRQRTKAERILKDVIRHKTKDKSYNRAKIHAYPDCSMLFLFVDSKDMVNLILIGRKAIYMSANCTLQNVVENYNCYTIIYKEENSKMKIKVVYNHHYKKCKKERTKAKKAAKWFAKIRATNDKVVYKSAEIFVWPNSSIIFLDYGHQTDIMTLGKEAQSYIADNINAANGVSYVKDSVASLNTDEKVAAAGIVNQ